MGFFSFFKSKPKDAVELARQFMAQGRYHDAKTEVLNVGGEEAHRVYEEAERLQKQFEMAQGFVRPQSQPLLGNLTMIMRRPVLVRAFKHIVDQEKPAGTEPTQEETAASVARAQQRFVSGFQALLNQELETTSVKPGSYIEPQHVPAVLQAVERAEQRFCEQLGIGPATKDAPSSTAEAGSAAG